MPDDICGYREKYSETRRHNGRCEQDDREEREELAEYPDNRHKKYHIKSRTVSCEDTHQDKHLNKYHEEEHHHESDEFSDDDLSARDRLREHQIDGLALDLTSDESASEKEYDRESWELDKREPKVKHHSPSLAESERIESEWEEDEDDREKYDNPEKLVADNLAEGIESDGKHSRAR